MVLVPFLSRLSRHARAVTGTVKRHDVMCKRRSAMRLWDYDERGLEGRWPHVLARRAHRREGRGGGGARCGRGRRSRDLSGPGRGGWGARWGLGVQASRAARPRDKEAGGVGGTR